MTTFWSAAEESFFADLRLACRQPNVGHGHALGEGRFKKGGDICAHEVDFHKSLAVFTSPRANVVKVAWETEGFKTRPAKCTFRQRSCLVGLVHCKGDGCKREAQGMDPPADNSPSNLSESPIKRRPAAQQGSWRSQFKKLRESAGQAGALAQISLPKHLTEMCAEAFEACALLSAAALPQPCRSVGHRAFAECNSQVCLTYRSAQAGQHDTT